MSDFDRHIIGLLCLALIVYAAVGALACLVWRYDWILGALYVAFWIAVAGAIVFGCLWGLEVFA